MNLAAWAERNGVARVTAYRWFRAGLLPVVVNNAGVVVGGPIQKSIPLSQRLAGPPDKVAATVGKALTARSPRARYVVGVGPRLQLALMASLTTAARDSVLRRVSSQPGRGARRR
jgi:hypothetical protein